jgi:hypothetical protein
MASITRDMLAIALMVGLSLAVVESPTAAKKPSPGQKCEKSVKKSVKKFIKKRLKRVQNCANKATRKGTPLDTCFLRPTKLKRIKEKQCSSEALDDLGYSQECSSLNAACDLGPITDAATLTACLDCHLNQGTRCMVATTYNVTTELASCFPEPSAE